MAKLIIIRGYPGFGKTTLGKELQSRGIGEFIDHSAILTFIANIVGDDEGIYQDIANLELAMARKLLVGGRDTIVARGFSSALSVAEYLALAESSGSEVFIVRLQLPLDILRRRVQSPDRLQDFNPTVSPRILEEWIKSNSIEDIDGEFIINSDQSLSRVVDCVMAKLTDKR